MKIKIGLVLPNSNYLPGIAQDIYQALNAGLSEHDLEFETIFESGAYNATKNVVNDKFQQLIVGGGVDLIVAPLNPALLEESKEVLRTSGVPIIVNTLGEDLVADTYTNEFVFYNSLNEWQSLWLLGNQAVQQHGHKTVSLAALHDGGYGMHLAYALGVESADGKVHSVGVTHRNSPTEDPTEDIRRALEADPDYILGLYSGKEASSFWNTIDALSVDVPIVSNAFALEEQVLSEINQGSLKALTVSSWDKGVVDNEQRRQLEKIQEVTKKAPHAYSVLAYETGHMIGDALLRLNEEGSLASKLTIALKGARHYGPRGEIAFDAETREVNTEHYLIEVEKKATGEVTYSRLEVLRKPDLLAEQLTLAKQNLQKQGWLNPYLIA